MENVNRLVRDKLWNHTGSKMKVRKKDEISSQVIKIFDNTVSRQIMNQTRFKVWRPVLNQVSDNVRSQVRSQVTENTKL